MAERATLPISLSQGKPMLLVLTDQPALVLQDTLELDQGLEQADETLAEVIASHPFLVQKHKTFSDSLFSLLRSAPDRIITGNKSSHVVRHLSI